MNTSSSPIALVTGSRTGLGKSIAYALAARGFHVMGCSRQIPDWTLQRYEHVQADVSDERQVVSLLSHIRRAYGRFDIVVNNAGIASMNHSLLVPGSTVDRMLGVNVRGTFLVCRESAKLMQRRKSVNAVGPSPVDTDLMRNVPQDRLQQHVDRLAIKYMGTPEDVVNVIDFFIRPESDYITGQVIYLGGM